MKKSRIALLIVFFLLIPLTLYLGLRLQGQSYYLTGTIIIIELMIPFFMAFEGRKPQARELVVLAVMCALSIVARIAIPIQHFKAIFAVIMITGIAFGPEAGFVVGALAAFVSNFWYGHGAHTPWQMMAYGAGGMLAGFLFAKGRLPRKPIVMAVFGFLTVVLFIGPLLDCSGIFIRIGSYNNFKAVMAVFAAGVPVNVSQGICTVAVMLLFAKPLLEKLDRVKRKYGMMEAENGL